MKEIGRYNKFIFRDAGSKLDYAITHPDVDDGKTTLGWIRKFCVEHCVEKEDV